MTLEVRTEKPSKPEKWDLPADMSLRTALERSLAEEMSRLDGTLAVTSSSLSKTRTRTKTTEPPRHELFFQFGTEVKLTAELHRKLVSEFAGKQKHAKEKEKEKERGPLKDHALLAKLEATPFTRIVLVFKYLDDATLHAVEAAVRSVNLKAFPNIQGSIRSYSLTPEEEQAAIHGKLDCVSGFMIIDDDTRLVVLEGLAAPGKGMQSIFVDLPRAKPNDQDLTILCNPEILFPDRSPYPFTT
jgi:hypothetical protein